MGEIRGNCSFCSLACPLVIRGGERGPVFTAESVLGLDWDDRSDSKFGGSLCARGNAVIGFVSHPKRLNYPFILGERSTFGAAVKETAKNLSEVKKESGSDSIGVLLGGNLTNEEAALALRFTRDVLGTANLALFAPDDVPIFRAHLGCDLSGLKSTGKKPGGEREVTLVVGDPFTEHPCIAKQVLQSRYAARGNEIIAISPCTNNTSWFANRHLRCRPGGEAAVAAGLLGVIAGQTGASLTPELGEFTEGIDWDEVERIGGVTKDGIEEAASSLLGAVKVRAYVSNIFGRIGAPGLTALLIEAVTRICPGESEFTPQFVQQNTWGIYSVIAGDGKLRVFEKLGSADLKALVLLGLDLFSVYPAAPVENALREKRFTVTTQLFWSQTASRANVVIPAADLIEKRGTVSPAFGEDLFRSETLSPPGGSFTDGEFLLALAREMGSSLQIDATIERRSSRSTKGAGLDKEWAEYTGAMKELETAEVILIPWSEPVHVADGSLSRNFPWSEITCPEPKLMVSKELGDEMKIKNGERVTVTTDGGKAVLPIVRTSKLEGHIVGATIHFPSVRRLFPWKLDGRSGEIVLMPVAVQLSPQSEKS